MEDNLKLYCTVHYTYDNEIPETLKPLYQEMFMLMRNSAIELLNPNYELWNEEYGNVDDLEHYNKFIQKKQREVLKKFNKQHEKAVGKLIYLDSDEEGDIIGVMPSLNSVMHMSIKLINN